MSDNCIPARVTDLPPIVCRLTWHASGANPDGPGQARVFGQDTQRGRIRLYGVFRERCLSRQYRWLSITARGRAHARIRKREPRQEMQNARTVARGRPRGWSV
jgi:hypothetical protein